MTRHSTTEPITTWFEFGTIGPKSGKSDKPIIPPELFDAFKAECAAHQCRCIVEAFYCVAKADVDPSDIERVARTLLGVLNDRLKIKTGDPAANYSSCVETVQTEQTVMPSETDVLIRLNKLHDELRQLKVSTDIRQKFDMLSSLIEGNFVYAKWPATNFGSPNVGDVVARNRQCTAEVVLIRVTHRFVFGLTFEVIPLFNTPRAAMHTELRRKLWLATLPDDLIKYIEAGYNDGNLQANLSKACNTGVFGMPDICSIVMAYLNTMHKIDRPFSSKALELAYMLQPYNEAIGRLNEIALHYRPSTDEVKRIDGLLSAVASHTGVGTAFPESSTFLGYGPKMVIDEGFPQVGAVWYSTDEKGRIVEHRVIWRGLFTMAVRDTVIHPNGDRQVKMIEM